MKIKKYPQSHLVITGDNTKILIDPGYITFDPSTPFGRSGQVFTVEEFQGMDGYLITHQHADHVDPQRIKEIVGVAKVYGNADVVAKLNNLGIQGIQVNDRESFKIGEFEITPINLPHFPHPLGNQMPPNTGFIIDGIFFHAGDGFELEGLAVKNAALPLGHPSLSTTQVLNFAKSLEAKLIIPIHYDVYLRDPNELAKLAKQLGIEVRVLNWGEETTI